MSYSNVCLLGASFSTGNLGVSALALSSISLIKKKDGSTKIFIVGAGKSVSSKTIEIAGEEVVIFSYPVRYTPNIFVENHIISIIFGMALLRVFPSLKKGFNSDTTLGVMAHSHLFCDITGGDSFSDIYGFTRFFKGFLLKQAAQFSISDFIMLPQTYGPFKGRLCQLLAKIILNKATLILSRDKDGVKVIQSLLGETEKIKLCPDVAFTLTPIPFENSLVSQIKTLKKSGNTIIGLNISGLLYYGGYSGKNELGLSVDYQQLIRAIIKKFVSSSPNINILLVPHVFAKNKMAIEDDVNACQLVYDSFPEEIQQQLLFPQVPFNQSEAKYLIGLSDFFMGARMHSCIAAISQCIPTIGMAYSKKFVGVFDTVGVTDCIVDMRKSNNTSALSEIDFMYQNRKNIHNRLINAVPKTKEKIKGVFDVL